MVYSWSKQTGLANLGVSSLQGSRLHVVNIWGDKAMVVIFFTLYQHLHMDQKKALCLSEPRCGDGVRILAFYHRTEARILDMTVSILTAHVHSGPHSSVPSSTSHTCMCVSRTGHSALNSQRGDSFLGKTHSFSSLSVGVICLQLFIQRHGPVRQSLLHLHWAIHCCRSCLVSPAEISQLQLPCLNQKAQSPSRLFCPLAVKIVLPHLF